MRPGFKKKAAAVGFAGITLLGFGLGGVRASELATELEAERKKAAALTEELTDTICPEDAIKVTYFGGSEVCLTVDDLAEETWQDIVGESFETESIDR